MYFYFFATIWLLTCVTLVVARTVFKHFLFAFFSDVNARKQKSKETFQPLIGFLLRTGILLV